MNNDKIGLNLDLRGIDMVTPVDLLQDGHTPWSKNFRLYAQQADDRQVAVSSRKGPGYYMDPLVETVDFELDNADEVDIPIGVTANVFAQYVSISGQGRVNRIDLKLRKTQEATGPVLISVYSVQDERPTDLLSQSSVDSGDINEDYSWHTIRFHRAPLVDEHELYVVVEIQDDGTGLYELSGANEDTTSMFSDVSFAALEPVEYSANIRAYLTPDDRCKGAFRFNREDGHNITVAVYGDTLYALEPEENNWRVVTSDLNPLASEYSFDRADGKVFWVNGFDDLMAWDGTFRDDNPNLMANGSFDVDLDGWFVDDNETISRDTVVYNSAPASLKAPGASYTEINSSVDLAAGVVYKVSHSIRLESEGAFRIEGHSNEDTGNTNVVTPTYRPEYGIMEFKDSSTYVSAPQRIRRLKWTSENAVTFNLDDITIQSTGVEVITDPELPILSQIVLHKDRLFGVAANDKNRIVWSEAPGNPSNAPVNEQWYRAWLSTSFAYIPAPKTGAPITGLLSFQDSLTIFTQNTKYIFSGYDKGSFFLRQSTGSKGALSRRGIVSDENFIYFVADDGLYQFNGSADKNISEVRIQPLFDAVPRKHEITPVVWKNKVRWYMASQGSPVNDICALYNPGLDDEWELDLDTYVDRAVHFDDADDNGELLEFSSHYALPMLAESNYNSLGAPIDFEYRFKYESFGVPAQKKRLRRYFPILQGVDSTFNIQIGMDKDFEDSPRTKDVTLAVEGSTWGSFAWDSGITWGGDKSFQHHRQSYSGAAYYWQLRLARKGVNNRVAFTGAQYKYRIKRM